MSHRKRNITFRPRVEELSKGNYARVGNKDVPFLRFLFDSKGGSRFLLDTLDNVSKLAESFYRKNKTYQRIIKTLKYSAPSYLLSTELINSYKEYKQYKKELSQDAYGERIDNVRYLLGGGDKEFYNLPLFLGSDIVNWLFSSPNTSTFKIKGFYSSEDNKKVSNLCCVDRGSFNIVIEYLEKKFLWEVSFSRFGVDFIVHDSSVHTLAEDELVVKQLKESIFKEFMNHFDIENNVLVIGGYGYSSRPKISKVEEINQFNIKSFSEEIYKVLTRGLKRGYALVGVPGVGKSSIIRALESVDNLKGTPFIYLDNTSLQDEGSIKNTFKDLQNIQPFIAVIEDFDSLDFSTKNSRLGVFLNEIDSVNQNLNGVIIMTVNDTSLIHYTAINRPGRIDEVRMISLPSTPDDIYHVIKSQYYKRYAKGNYLSESSLIELSEIEPQIFDGIIEHKCTQADICEIVDKALLLNDCLNNKTIKESFQSLCSSKQAIKECNFKDLEPNRSMSEECFEINNPVERVDLEYKTNETI